MAAVSTTDSVDTGADPAAAAKEAFKRGQSRLRVENLEDAIIDLMRAVELAPNEVDYAATLAWARFCHTTDKQALAPATREALAKAIRRSQSPETARFYLGRVERMLGRDQVALRHFREVLDLVPGHTEAASEIRVLESRLARGTRPPRTR
jgi:cytochrome c-type biogenesis protein CcmH/NrfG